MEGFSCTKHFLFWRETECSEQLDQLKSPRSVLNDCLTNMRNVCIYVEINCIQWLEFILLVGMLVHSFPTALFVWSVVGDLVVFLFVWHGCLLAFLRVVFVRVSQQQQEVHFWRVPLVWHFVFVRNRVADSQERAQKTNWFNKNEEQACGTLGKRTNSPERCGIQKTRRSGEKPGRTGRFTTGQDAKW